MIFLTDKELYTPTNQLLYAMRTFSAAANSMEMNLPTQEALFAIITSEYLKSVNLYNQGQATDVRIYNERGGQRTLLQWEPQLAGLLNAPNILFAKTKEFVMFSVEEPVGILKRVDRSMTYVTMRPLGMTAVTANNNTQNSSDVTIYQKTVNSIGSLKPYPLQPNLPN